MNKNIEKRLIDIVDRGDRGGAVLFGRDSAKELASFQVTIDSRGYPSTWIENPRSESEFWAKLLKGIKRNEMNNTTDLEVLMGSVKYSLRDLTRQHYLFIPDIDIIFYKFDPKEPFLFGSTLRATWATQQDKLFIFGSVRSNKSKSYLETLDRYEYPMWNNLMSVHL